MDVIDKEVADVNRLHYTFGRRTRDDRSSWLSTDNVSNNLQGT